VIATNRETTRAFGAGAQLPVHYMGAAEQAAFMQRIIAHSPALEDALRLLVDRERWASHWTSGLARTVALLLSVGERLLVLDDDIVCSAYEPYLEQGGVGFGDAVREAAVFTDDAQWQQFQAPAGPDPLARHARVLGLGLGDALSASGVRALSPTDFVGARVDDLERLDATAPVLVSECGSLGDPGTPVSNWLTSLEGASRERLLADEATVQAALRERNYWHGRSRTHVAMRSNMSQLTGLDNRRLLPPYIPVMRGEDRLFGNMLEAIHPRHVVLDQAFAVPHLPTPRRRWSAAESAFSTRESFPGFILNLFSETPLPSDSQDPLRRLALVANQFDELAERRHQRLVTQYIDERLSSRARRYVHLKSLRAECADAPPSWLAYLDAALADLNQKLADNPVETSLRGYPESLSDVALSEWWQDFWRRFAQALRAWPALRQAARHCRDDQSSR
jgi:hypothetical protein